MHSILYLRPLSIKEVYKDELFVREMPFNFEEDYYFEEDNHEIVSKKILSKLNINSKII